MEDFSRTLNLVSTEEIPEGVWNAIENSLGSKEGVSYKRNSQNSFSIKFPSYQYSSEYILDIVKSSVAIYRPGSSVPIRWQLLCLYTIDLFLEGH